ncbi:MAG: hypothetical protein A3F09_01470 [Chlamydiae bacterium RIFCSPHIGHO2_12_FULL_49_11]|nr:MAG: hypothetical protein A3F09_01470 [Chlamydiae bacterium RIFCSPHIGHO2_12_FULL_49_11]
MVVENDLAIHAAQTAQNDFAKALLLAAYATYVAMYVTAQQHSRGRVVIDEIAKWQQTLQELDGTTTSGANRYFANSILYWKEQTFNVNNGLPLPYRQARLNHLFAEYQHWFNEYTRTFLAFSWGEPDKTIGRQINNEAVSRLNTLTGQLRGDSAEFGVADALNPDVVLSEDAFYFFRLRPNPTTAARTAQVNTFTQYCTSVLQMFNQAQSNASFTHGTGMSTASSMLSSELKRMGSLESLTRALISTQNPRFLSGFGARG